MVLMKKTPHKYTTMGETTIIFITKKTGENFNIIIDTTERDRVLQHRWCTNYKNRYFQASIKGKSIYLHHFIAGHPRKNRVIDHRDRNTLNNKKENLFHVSKKTNQTNRKITNKYGFPGLSYWGPQKEGGKTRIRPWQVRIRIQDLKSPFNGKDGKGTRLLHLGMFETKKEAIAARKKAEIKYHGVELH